MESRQGKYKDGNRVHIFITRDYLDKIERYKTPGEANTHFVKRCIDFFCDSVDKEVTDFSAVKVLLERFVPPQDASS